MDVKDKVAIVTGASSGIGEATARLLSEKGAKVALVARSKEKLENLSKELDDSFVATCDMTKEDAIRSMVKTVFDHYGHIDILVNNAGRGYDARIETVDPKMFREIFDLDVLGPVIAMQEVIPLMKKQGGGAIINISSGTALMSLPGMSPYSSMKRALVGISLTAREELEDDHISVSVVFPYITKTNFEKNTIGSSGEDFEPDVDSDLAPADSAAFVAEKILLAIKTGEKEVYAHSWMKRMG